jgi:hypothetical protein
MGLHFAVFYGSVRSERLGIKYARFLNAQLAARGHQVSFVDPLEYRLPLLDKMHKEYPAGAAPDPLLKLADIIRAVMRPSVAAAASRKNALLFDCESEAPQGIVDCGIGIRNSPL